MPLVDSLTRTRLKIAALVIASLFANAGAGAGAQVIFKTLIPSTKQITPETIQALEQLAALPAGAAPITSYDRYYAPGIFEKREVVVGVFLKRPARLREGAQAIPGYLSAYATTVEKLPRIPGGGCNVVTLYFDLANGRFIRLPAKGKDTQVAVCNGLS